MDGSVFDSLLRVEVERLERALAGSCGETVCLVVVAVPMSQARDPRGCPCSLYYNVDDGYADVLLEGAASLVKLSLVPVPTDKKTS
jgi:hypothetical protein